MLDTMGSVNLYTWKVEGFKGQDATIRLYPGWKPSRKESALHLVADLLRYWPDDFNQVIDMQVGTASYCGGIADETFWILTNDTLSDEFIKELGTDLAILGGRIVLFELSVLSNPKLCIEKLVESGEHSDCGCPLHQKEVVDIKEFPIPRLTDGPLTGRNVDSWNNALSTHEAKAWFARLGGVYENTRTIAIHDQHGKHKVTIGFPKHKNDAKKQRV
jgi:hypothetical protein